MSGGDGGVGSGLKGDHKDTKVEWSGSDERERLSGLHPPQLHSSTSPSFLLFFFDSFFSDCPDGGEQGRRRKTGDRGNGKLGFLSVQVEVIHLKCMRIKNQQPIANQI